MNYLKMTGYIVRTASDNWTLGYEGENNARTLRVKTTDSLTNFATVNLLIDTLDCGAMTIQTVSNYRILEMVITEEMLGLPGLKTCQLVMKNTAGSVVLKTNQFYMYVKSSNVTDRIYISTEDTIKAALTALINDGVLEDLSIEDGSITTSKIANGAITQAKLDPNISFEADGELDATSTNAIQNKVVAQAIGEVNESLGNIDLSNLSSGMKEAIMQLGLHDALIEESYLYTYDYTDESYSRFSNATSDILSVSQGTLGIKGGGAGATFKTAVFFDENVNEIEYAFESNNNYYCYPLLSSAWIERNTDTVKSIKYLPLNKDGWNGLWRTFTDDWHTQAMQATNKWVAETPISKVRIKKNTETFTLTFTHTDDTTTVKTITLADIGATGHFPERLGLLVGKAVTNAGTSFATNVKISSSAIFLTSVSAADSPLYGVTWDAWGDSITAGSESYHSYVAADTGCTVNNYGVAGDKMSSVLSRYNANTAASGEYITVFAGVNDYLHATSATSFRSTVQSFLSAIVAKDPFARCGFITPMQKLSQDANSEGLTLEDYVDIILEECAAKSMPVLDLYHGGNWYGFNTDFSNAYTSDGLHPNASGHAYLGRKIQKWLESM